MQVKNLKIYKVDIESNEIREILSSDSNTDFKKYLDDIIKQVLILEKSRRFSFISDTSEMHTLIIRSTFEDQFEESCKRSAERLLGEEIKAQTRIAQMGTEIQKGILIHAHVNHEEIDKFIICKADDTPYINEVTLKLANGFPLKRKIFKSLVTQFTNTKSMIETYVYDTTKPFSSYWWSDYLELQAVLDDEENTIRAFQALDNVVLAPLKKESPNDHFELRNALVTTMKSNNSFDVAEYADEILSKYTPSNKSLDMKKLALKAKDLPRKYNFDNTFNLAPKSITAKVKKQVISLTENIDLTIKDNIDTEGTIVPFLDKSRSKYIGIRSDIGYDTFKQNKK